MFDRLSRAWELTKQSGRVLRSDKQLMVFPILSTIATLLVLATFAVPMIFAVDWATVFNQAQSQSGSSSKADIQMQPWYYAVMFLFYFCNFFVITFFNCALVACAINKFSGQDSSVGAGLRVATSRLPQILAWSAVAATVGVILQAIQERVGWLGQFVLNLIGMVWTIATFFVVPVLVVEKVGPFDAIKRSVQILKKTWGETLVANLGISAVTMIAVLLAIVPTIALIAIAVATDTPWLIAIGVAITIILCIAIALISSTLKTILLAATYQYAATGNVPAGFDSNLLQQAFKQKGAK